MYGALFAAVGASVDSMQESQQFNSLITLPLLMDILGCSCLKLRDPQGTISSGCRLFPFTSPVARDRPDRIWCPLVELALHGFIGGWILLTTWVAGRIYRVGILNDRSQNQLEGDGEIFMIK